MPILKIALTAEGAPRAWDVELTDREMTLGRDKGCAIPLDDKAVSRNHARLLPTAQGWMLQDLGSSNGTWVNMQRITEALLKDGDEIRIGACVLRFTVPPDQAKTVMMGQQELRSYLPPQPAAAPPPPPPSYAAPPPAPAPPPRASQPPYAPPPRPQTYAPPPPPPPAYAPPTRPYAPPPPGPAPLPPPVANYPTPPLAPPPPRLHPAAGGAPPAYAGFWIRFLAYILDSLILGFAMGILMIPAALLLRPLRYEPEKMIFAAVAVYGLLSLLGVFYILFFWAVKGATPGKKALGLRIVREDGVDPPGWGTAILRLLGYLVDGFTLYIGFIMIGFTDRKRGLHDMIAGTTVVKVR